MEPTICQNGITMLVTATVTWKSLNVNFTEKTNVPILSFMLPLLMLAMEIRLKYHFCNSSISIFFLVPQASFEHDQMIRSTCTKNVVLYKEKQKKKTKTKQKTWPVF